MKGYLDRIEENQHAVIIVDEINKEFIIPISQLPNGSTAGSYLNLIIENETITSITLNENETISQQQKVDDMMSKLRKKSSGSKFKKKD
ncbi:DUF3006 domain-containing protein [Fredinandcohnia onubensis]|jgi:Protein of unknown function (DUF3006)|uniref:DUF3006 domain-containing protein n=1 Tax=Fredinandcohnia onubensis TaxID=1571209 RepID=UPI000C0C02A7|nr:DUF3006 domain-containing protein [Fredinandcohnia onubensis]